MQSRDPFSGDCDPALAVARWESPRIILAEPRPVLRGLRPRQGNHWRPPVGWSCLQSRDPFSGDCDLRAPCSPRRRDTRCLQSRDPFSGDCDAVLNRDGRSRAAVHLAEPRPVLRGLRRDLPACQGALPKRLAEPRPVLRGLRPVQLDIKTRDVDVVPCRAETRSQGIATSAFPPGDENSEQPLAEPRPVLRGLRPARIPLDPGRRRTLNLQSRDPFSGDCDAARPAGDPRRTGPGLQSRDPFSGDCDLDSRGSLGWRGNTCLQSRDPFSGDCDSMAPAQVIRRASRRACRAETRSQGIATWEQQQRTRRPGRSCRAETRSQGIATGREESTMGTPARRLAEPRPVLRGLRQGCHHVSHRLALHLPCRAETRSQGIATVQLLRSSITAAPSLQSRDPFSGDCDSRSSYVPTAPPPAPLQSRDPFSGDCDPGDGPLSVSVSGGLLAEPRPVLRGLRQNPPRGGFRAALRVLQSRDPFSGDCDPAPPGRGRRREVGLAEPRPVLRGLRHQHGNPPGPATIGPGLAEPRPVLRGLRRGASGAGGGGGGPGLQSRDPFSGDCDSTYRSPDA